MNHLINFCKVSCPLGLTSSVLGAVDAQGSGAEALEIIYIVLAIIGAIGTIIVTWLTVYTKIKAKIDKAKEDGKITEDEINEIVQTAKDSVQTAVDETEKQADGIKDKIEKEGK